MPSPLTKKCRGLYTASNRYDVPEGALVQANNILIVRDGVIQPRWGLQSQIASMAVGNVSYWHRMAVQGTTLWGFGKDSGTTLYNVSYATLPTPSTMTLFASSEDSPDGCANFASSSYGLYYDVETFLNRGNLYGNLSRGLIRYETTAISRRAGGFPCAVSCFPRPLNGTKSGAGPSYTFTTTIPHGYSAGVLVTFSGGGATGEYAVTPVSGNPFAFTYTDAGATSAGATTATASNIVGSSGFMATDARVAYRACLTEYDSAGNAYVGEVSGRIVVTDASPFVGAGNNKNVQLAVLFPPAALAANTKLELFRSETIASAEPLDQMGVVYTKYLKADEIAQGYTWIIDITPDSKRFPALYINEDQDGADQNGLRPAACKTVAKWGERIVQANTFDHPSFEMQLLSTIAASGGLAAGDTLNLGYSTSPVAYAAIASGTAFSTSYSFTIFTGGTASTDCKNTVLSLIDTINWNGGTNSLAITPLATYNAIYTSVGGDWPARFAVRVTTPDQTEITSAAGQIRGVFAKSTGTSARGAWAPKLAQANRINDLDRDASNNVTAVTTSNHNFEVGEYVVVYSTWASQTQLADSNGVLIEGQITSVTATNVVFTCAGAALSNIAADGTIAVKYRPLFNPNHVVNRIKVSKVSRTIGNQPEAFPAFNTLDVGASGMKILKCVECKESLLVFKEDGLFRVTASGDTLSAEKLDSTLSLWAKDSAVACGDKVMAWTTKGVALIGEHGVEKYVSAGRLDDKLPPLGSSSNLPISYYPFSRRANGYFDAKNNIYELRVHFGTTAPFASTHNFTYNLENDTWVTDDVAVVGEVFYNGDRFIQEGTVLLKEQGDYVPGYPAATSTLTFTSSTADSTGNVWSFTYTGTVAVGSYLIGGALEGYVISASGGVGTAYIVSTQAAIRAETWNDYGPLVSTVEWAPITLVEENKLKQFAEVQVLFGQRPSFVAEVSTYTELVSTAEQQTCKLGGSSTSANNFTYSPYNLRVIVPQQHRIAQQLSVKLVVRAAGSSWTLFGLGVSGRVIGPRVNR